MISATSGATLSASLRTGTTTVEAKSGYGLTIEDELKILRAIKQLNEETPLNYVPTFLGAHDIPSEYKSRRQMYVNLVINDMLGFTDGPVPPFAKQYAQLSEQILSAVRAYIEDVHKR